MRFLQKERREELGLNHGGGRRGGWREEGWGAGGGEDDTTRANIIPTTICMQ